MGIKTTHSEKLIQELFMILQTILILIISINGRKKSAHILKYTE